MIKKVWNRVVCVLVCIAIVFSSSTPGYASSKKKATLSDITSDTIKEKENQLSEAEALKTQLQSSVTDTKKVLEGLESTKKDLANYVTQLDASLMEIEDKLTELTTLIDEKLAEIEVTTAELNAAQKVADEQYEAMKARIKFLYEKGDTFYLELILSAESFGDLLNKSEYVAMLSAYDRKMLTEYQETAASIASLKLDLEAEQMVLEEAKVTAQAEQDAMSTLISAKEQQINEYEADIDNREELLADLQNEIAAQDEAIALIETTIAEEKKKVALANGYVLTYDGGAFTWPAPSYTRISDDYGYRIHPILQVQQFHNGVDMASPSGTPILAAYDGTVVAASYSSTMGNYIMIDHGDSLYTIYMHASALYVEKNDLVVRGEKIAAVGSTGRSTGPHLHFSVRLNGSYVSPWNYFS